MPRRRLWQMLVWCTPWLVLTIPPASIGQVATPQPAVPRIPPPEFHPSHVLVRYRAEAIATVQGERVVALAPGRSIARWSQAVPDLAVMEVPEGTVKDVIAELSADPDVLYAEPDYKAEFLGIPNDPDFARQWALLNVGQTVDNDPGIPGADINVTEAWDLWTGDPDFKIAIVDTGIAWTHPDLARNMWVNPGEIPSNGVDDDGNGWVDDIYGYNPAAGHGVAFDSDGHGTHIAGVIGAATDNSRGIAGINHSCSLVALKVGTAQTGAYLSAVLEAIDYMLAMDIHVSNNSWGCYECFSQSLLEGIQRLNRAGHIFVTAAGNGFLGLGTDNDLFEYYPANYDVPNVITVASLNNNDRKPKSSNFGRHSVEVGAPGVNIYSTFINNDYAFLDGTSMATAQVTGVVGLAMSRTPTMGVQRLRDLIVLTARPVNALADRTISGGMVDALGAVGDCNRNGIFDETDIADGNSSDCNLNMVPDECEPDCNLSGMADSCDIDVGVSRDCDLNRVPDECEPDCNGNRTADDCDITGGFSGDCDANGVPDECQFGSGIDCNLNGVDDLCDLAAETSRDCNGNGLPDECDIRGHLSEDCTGNGMPDECERDCNHNGIADSCDIASGTVEDQDNDGVPDECSLGFILVPVGAEGPYTIVDRGITIPTGANTLTFEVLISGWDPDQDGDPRLLTYQAAIDAESFASGDGAPLTLAVIPCEDNEGCLANAECLHEGICEPIGSYNVDESHPNFIFAGYDTVTLSDVGRTRLGSTLFTLESPVVDTGVERYAATLILDVPEDAAGTYTIGFRELESFLSNDNQDDNNDIPIAGYLPATVEILPDCNHNGVSDPEDILNETSEDCDLDGVPDECVDPVNDCNGNLVPDTCDIDENFSRDCNLNGVPDECIELERDCNSNLRPDECDIADGISPDCNLNAIPDECIWLEDDCNHNREPDACDISRGAYQDCNDDGIPDVCQFDCNHNGLADECDLAAGTSVDLEGNGVPDECQHVLLVPDEYPTIQAGIDAAQRGDTVLLAEGTYTGVGNYDIRLNGKILTLRSISGPESCIIDATGQQSGIGILNGEDRRTIVEGITIRKAWNAGLVVSDASPRILNCIIENNGPVSSGVLVMRRSAPLLADCVIRHNVANFGGGGIRSIDFSTPTIERCLITENISSDWGGGVFGAASDMRVVQSTITGNSAVAGGGGLAFTSGRPLVHGCVVSNNTAKPSSGNIGDGGGISATRAEAVIANTLIEGNSSGATGGGVYLLDGDSRLVNCTVIGNRTYGRGGGVHQDGAQRDTWACCLFEGCTDLMTLEDCDASAGIWYPELDCRDVDCDTKACCLPDGSCANLNPWDCTLADGEPHLDGTQCASADCRPTLGNSIVWFNRSTQGDGINLGTTTPLLTVMNSNTPGSWPGLDNSLVDPDFVSVGTWGGSLWIPGDSRLRIGSIGIDTGRNTLLEPDALTDLDGFPRTLCNRVDRGAYEHGIGDFNCDNAIDQLDFSQWHACLNGIAGADLPPGCEAFDFDGDSDVDMLDFGAFQNYLALPKP